MFDKINDFIFDQVDNAINHEKTKEFLKNEKGAETLEYIAIATIVIIAGAAAYDTAGIEDVITAGLNRIKGFLA